MEKIKRAIRIYNRYRSPEARARLVGASEDRVDVEVAGSFCETCGIYDWLEDLVYVAQDLGFELELVDARQVSEDTWIASYKIKR